MTRPCELGLGQRKCDFKSALPEAQAHHVSQCLLHSLPIDINVRLSLLRCSSRSVKGSCYSTSFSKSAHGMLSDLYSRPAKTDKANRLDFFYNLHGNPSSPCLPTWPRGGQAIKDVRDSVPVLLVSCSTMMSLYSSWESLRNILRKTITNLYL